jgi:hypothetical protein
VIRPLTLIETCVSLINIEAAQMMNRQSRRRAYAMKLCDCLLQRSTELTQLTMVADEVTAHERGVEPVLGHLGSETVGMHEI